jgi:predicted P-loop ATPase
MTEKRQTSQGYIIRILQHFATKFRNITNFVMLFQAVMNFLFRLVEIKISLKRGKVYLITSVATCSEQSRNQNCNIPNNIAIFRGTEHPV